MEKRYALILSFLFTGIIASEFILFSLNYSDKEIVQISRVIDGDTLVLSDDRHIRLLNINTPEKDMPNYEQSKKYLEEFINQTMYLQITGIDKYKRVLGKLYDSKGNYINLKLVKNGLSSKFLVSDSELSEFNIVENRAIKEGIGIWNHSNYFNCAYTKINKDEEYVSIFIICNVSTEGWYLKDESRKIYKFDLPVINGLTLFSYNGSKNETALYWNQGNVWNNDRDTLYLFDKEGRIIYSHSYGY